MNILKYLDIEFQKKVIFNIKVKEKKAFNTKYILYILYTVYSVYSILYIYIIYVQYIEFILTVSIYNTLAYKM